MIFMLRDDQVIQIFEAPSTVRDAIEAIDIENQEYQFCDENGQRYIGVITESIGWFRSGNFETIVTI
jgi:predicted GTPase